MRAGPSSSHVAAEQALAFSDRGPLVVLTLLTADAGWVHVNDGAILHDRRMILSLGRPAWADRPSLRGDLVSQGGEEPNPLWSSFDRNEVVGAIVDAMAGIKPKDEIEGMIAAQLLAAHNAAME
jgi:hypothetical protein